MSLIYLSSPYSDPDKFVRMERYKVALRACDLLMELGEFVFSPIAYAHAFEAKMGKHYNLEYWLAWDLTILARCDRLYVLTIGGWDTSAGIKLEVQKAHELGIPVIGYSTELDEDSQISGLDILGAFGCKIERPQQPFRRIEDDQQD